ncbi:NUDIX hydrolase [Bacillus infantis]|uniref:NUDIX hydrolase n=1 Tax=Bacillus infantis TaxID=324767 RepID=UPI000B9BFF00|nr:NUDIX domain-containing protein [Bacillus infantis]MCK6205387.1 NUDIX domain-containing protein [Bacillus infantis]OXT14802.1 DNA mismatch repair protein MutT [Bacillus sp. OG2]
MFIVNVEGAVHRGGKWLIGKRSSQESHAGGMLALIGGKAEKEGHSTDVLERTVKREILEETGVLIKDGMEYVCSSSFITDDGYHVIDIVFLCEYQSGEASPVCPDENEEVMWMSIREILEQPDAPEWLTRSLTAAEDLLRKKEMSKRGRRI